MVTHFYMLTRSCTLSYALESFCEEINYISITEDLVLSHTKVPTPP